MKEVYVNSEHINTLETFLDLTPIVCGPIYLFILLLYKVLVHHLMRICARFLSKFAAKARKILLLSGHRPAKQILGIPQRL